VSGRHHYRVNTRGDRRRDGSADDRLVYSLYYPPHDGRAARIKERCVDNARVGLPAAVSVCTAARRAKQSGCTGQSTDGRGRCAGGTSVKSCETDQENGYKNQSPVFSYERSRNVHKFGLYYLY